MLIWADEARHFTDFSNITSLWRHNNILLKIWFKIWNQSITISLSGEFQLIILSIGWDNTIWPKKNESFFNNLAKQKRQ